MSQSPIRLQATVKKTGVVDALPLLDPLKVFEIQYTPGASYSGVFEGEEGHKNYVLTGSGPHVIFRGVTYELKKIHIHSGSEHIVGEDDPDDLELHLIHAPLGSPVESPLVVIGILFKIRGAEQKSSKERTGIQKLIKGMKSKKCPDIEPLTYFPLLPAGGVDTVNWFHYEGSLTSYPYAEIVSWIVMKTPSDITKDVVDLVAKANQHARELQPLDRRLVVRSFS